MKPSIAWPLVGKYPITFVFGEAPAWYTRVFGYPHNGIDIGCPVGTGVLATDTGKVIFADAIPDGDGMGLILQHEWGISLYWHLNSLSAILGGACDKGALVGESGNTGYTTGPHLHFGIKVLDEPVEGMRGWCDPQRYISETVIEPAPPAAIAKTHLVMPGDTLWGLADKYYRNGTEWRRIYLANQDKISNPNLIRPLMRLVIP